MPETLEVEVIEIDGAPPQPAPSSSGQGAKGAVPPSPSAKKQGRGSYWSPFSGLPDWRTVLGRISRLDRRWWPLWVVLGLVVISLLVTVGLLALTGLIVLGMIKAVLRLLLGGGGSSSGPTFTVTTRRF